MVGLGDIRRFVAALAARYSIALIVFGSVALLAAPFALAAVIMSADLGPSAVPLATCWNTPSVVVSGPGALQAGQSGTGFFSIDRSAFLTWPAGTRWARNGDFIVVMPAIRFQGGAQIRMRLVLTPAHSRVAPKI